MSLAFHKTFTLECENISKLLYAVSRNPFISNSEIAEATGIGIGKAKGDGKVRPTISYATYGGLISVNVDTKPRQIELTDIGKLVFARDRALKNPTSHWVLHYHLSKEKGGARAWSYFVQEFLPLNPSFNKSRLEAGLQEKFGDEAKIESINPGVLLKTYLDNRALGQLRLIRQSSRNEFMQAQPDIPTPYIISYILAEIWEAQHSTRMMVDLDALSAPGHLGSSVGLQGSVLQERLNALMHLGVIGQMREAPPYQVVRQWDDKLSLLAKAYEEAD